MGLEMGLPARQVALGTAQAHVARANGPMWRRAVLGLLDCGELRVEDQQHLVCHLEEHELPRQLAVDLKPDDVFVEGPHRVDVAAIENGLQNPRRAHQAMACFCMSTSSPMPFLASARSSPSVASEKGSPSAVPWISTMPPDPVITKLASVPAEESSG